MLFQTVSFFDFLHVESDADPQNLHSYQKKQDKVLGKHTASCANPHSCLQSIELEATNSGLKGRVDLARIQWRIGPLATMKTKSQMLPSTLMLTI